MPDYSIPVETVYQDWAPYMIRKSDDSLGVEILTVAGKHQLQLHLPSWCPDWTHRSMLRPLAVSNKERDRRLEQQSKSRKDATDVKVEYIKGHGFDRIALTFATSGDLSGSVRLGRTPSQIIVKAAIIEKISNLGM
jgi:hypothetical protein